MSDHTNPLDLTSEELLEARQDIADALIAAWEAEQDGNYAKRLAATLAAAAMAAVNGYDVGFSVDEKEPAFPCVIHIDLPYFGQVTFHLPQPQQPWDGHTTKMKWQRVVAYANVLAVEVPQRMLDDVQ